MSDFIKLLPDSVANQIAAGEVIQRPASLLKELMENAIDSGADEITAIIKDSGRTLVQVIDNGCGMSETDARMAFERHATSKIKAANDLFSIRTMGFRGEALASIAAVAQVELTTKTENSELGTKILISGSKVDSQTPVVCAKGSNFSVKNLFYNIPARRRFLKSDATEQGQNLTEFKRITLANPHIHFKLYHNDLLIFNLPSTNLKQRIINIIGKQNQKIQSQIIPVNIDTTILKISGFTGDPQSAKKTSNDQFFFVNKRFMKHPYFNRAITDAYNKLIPADYCPSYFLYFEINPEKIDINIHPTKTEIKFDDESTIWKILNAGIRESLGKFNAVPSIDFDTEGKIEMPAFSSNEPIIKPKIELNPNFNPFEIKSDKFKQTTTPKNWESLYADFSSSRKNEWEEDKTAIVSSSKINDNSDQLFKQDDFSSQNPYFQINNRFIVTRIKSGLLVIEQRKAHERILYEQFLHSINTNKSSSQQLLYPETISLHPEDAILLKEIENDLTIFGFDIQETEKNNFLINGVPAEFDNINAAKLLEEIIQSYKKGEVEPEKEIKEQLAKIMAKNCCMNIGEILTNEEIGLLIIKLFKCETPKYTPSGKPVIAIITNEEIEGLFCSKS